MSRAEELLNSLSEADVGTYTTDIDNERHIIINEDRTITVPTELRNIAVQYDHNVETVTFDCPRYWDEHDFSKMHVYINYRRPDGESFTYPAENLCVPKRDDSIIQFTWRISRNVTEVKGNITFLVCIKTVNDEGEEEPHWNSRICSDLTVLEGMDCSAHDVVDMYPDVIEAILTRVENLEGSGGLTDEQIEQAISNYLEEHPIEGGSSAPGADGKDGEDGADGFSPTVSVEEIEGGTRVTITDVEGDKSFDVLNGKDGEPGQNGSTPVKGVDYFTEEDIAEVAAEVSKQVTIDQVLPSQVVFPEGLTTNYAFGKVELNNGSAELIPPNGTLEDFFKALQVEKYPVTKQPYVSLSFSHATAHEVGTKLTPTYNATFNPGSYTYGPDTGVTVTSWEVTDTEGNSSTNPSGTFTEVLVGDDMTYKITAVATHTEGTMPVTNNGNEYPEGKIGAGSKSAYTSIGITGYRNTFYGTMTTKPELTSDVIRELPVKSNKTLVNGASFIIDIPVGAMRVAIAYPATLQDLSSVKDVNGLGAEIASSFAKQTIAVEGANGYDAIDYKVYVLDFAKANDTANTFTVTI